MSSSGNRPFYGEYAWAYTLLIDAPLARRCDFICDQLIKADILPGMHILDAGCGPGHYTVELARRGYAVTGLDASPQFIKEAQDRPEARSLPVSFVTGDILALPPTLQVDAILCRGVLNDLITEDTCQQALFAFANALRPGGLLIFDVRNWPTTVARKTREPVTEKTVQTERGLLTFSSTTQLDTSSHRLLISERHTLTTPDGERTVYHQFVMRCWTEGEVDERLSLAGIVPISTFGDYDARVPLGMTDRIVCIARR
ncbi:MAG TPA: class I SAM-dependent methyltransferase [Ktedonobacterales bacterium]|nr:class I SAM-dependent methyltransferase [Ktedonobacterales bacterium]